MSRNVRCNLNEEEAERVLSYFENELTPSERDELSAKFPQYIFYQTERRGKQRRCVCTNCGEFVIGREKEPKFFLAKHKERTRCPVCDQQATLYAQGRLQTGSSLERWEAAVFMRPAPDGGLLLLAGWGVKRYKPWNLMPSVDFDIRKIAYFNKGKRCMWKRNTVYTYCCGAWVPEGTVLLEEQKTVYEPFATGLYHSDGWYYLLGFENIQSTELKYCAIEQLYRTIKHPFDEGSRVDGIFLYLARYTEVPQLEMAVKLNMTEAASELVSRGVKNYKHLNWKARSAAAFLRLGRTDAKGFIKRGYDIEHLKELHEGLNAGIYRSTDNFAVLLVAFGGLANLNLAKKCMELSGLTDGKVAWYLQRLITRGQFQEYAKREALIYWRDYLEAARTLGYDLQNKTVVMPLDLRQRHDAATGAVKVKISEEAQKAYAKRKKTLEDLYCFRFGGFEIVIPEGVDDIVREGKVLQHCVGGYAQRHMEGKVDILFFRRVKKPGRPFMTIEMLPKKDKTSPINLVQMHGYKNEWYQNSESGMSAKDKYKWFLDAWFAWMKAGSKRDKKGQPVISAERQARA